MRPTCSLIVLASLCCLAIGTARAHAETAVVLVAGKAPSKDRTTVASAVRSAARSGGWQLVETPLAEPEVTTILACLKAPQRWACISPVLARKDIQRLIVVGVDPDASPDSNGALVLTEQIVLPQSDVATSDQRSCSKCIEETLTRIAFDLTKELLEEAAAGTGRTRLRILSTPPGAWITLDTTNVGLTDHTYSTFPGRHVVTVQRDGYQTETRTVDVIENQETTVAITLRANSNTPDPDAGRHPHLIPALVIGAGATAVVVGVVLHLPPDSGPQPKYLINAPGAACVIVGGLAIGLGGYLWARATKHAAPVAMPTAAITAGGGIIGWTGHF
jgi:PEGA domain